MAKLTIRSKKTKDLQARIEEEIARRPTRKVRLLRDFFDVWLAGLRGEVPKVFSVLEQDLVDRTDPEWSDYQRLKQKFEG